jgi:NADPH:quinone reductase-like Zn-dependent oxidoreductase
MKAIVQDRYGPLDVLQVRDVPQPTVKDDEVLVRVHAASVHPDVWHVMRGWPYALRIIGAGVRKPKNPVPGTDVAGHVQAVGSKVTRFKPGDEVFGECVRGHQWHNGGAYAEYAAAPEAALAAKPARLTFEQAAAVPTTGLLALRGVCEDGRVQPGQRVLINGAGGGVGTFAVQIAKANGADVTGVDSAGKLDMVHSIGADHVIDYAHEDFTRSGRRYDLIIDVPGNHSIAAIRRALTRRGTYVLIGHDGFGNASSRWIGSIGKFLRLVAVTPFVSQRMVQFGTDAKLETLKEHIDAGRLTPVVDRTFAMGDVREAIRYLETGEVRGKIVLTVA